MKTECVHLVREGGGGVLVRVGCCWSTTTGTACIVILGFVRPAFREVSGHRGTQQAIRVLLKQFPLRPGGRDVSLL